MRRSGTIARQALLVRVGRRNPERGRAATATRAEVIYTGPEFGPVRPASHGALVPVSPAVPALSTPAAVPAAAGSSVEPEQESDSLLPGEHTPRRRLSFALVQACTLASLSLGMIAIFLAMQGDVRLAAACLVACVAFDGLDGALARRLGVSSPFGAQMDSLADMCSFGLAAPVVVYASLVHSVPAAAAVVACILVALCAAIRLARFNVSPKDGKFFTGVPTTMVAAVLGLTVLIELPLPGFALVAGVAMLAFAMVSSFPYAKLARLLKLPPWLWLLPLVAAFVDARLTFVMIVVAYLVSGPMMWVRTRNAA